MLHRVFQLLLIAAYAAATVFTAALPAAACPVFNHPRHAEHTHGMHHADHHKDKKSAAPHGDSLKCCLGTCLIGVTLPPPIGGGTSIAFYGTRVTYPFEHSALSDRCIPPDSTPPRPIS
jgi:hypothetical protein